MPTPARQPSAPVSRHGALADPPSTVGAEPKRLPMSPPESAAGGMHRSDRAATVANEPRDECDDVARPLLPSPGGAANTVARVQGAGAMAEDHYMSLKALARYSGLSVRTLRAHIADPMHPLPCYRPSGGAAGKLFVRRSEFDRWMARYHVERDTALDAIVRDVLGDTAA